MLLTKDATRNNVIQTIEDYASELEKGDKFLLTYAGHGSQMKVEANDPDPEPDGFNETWCLYDGQLVDDELSYLFSKFKSGVRIVLISDSCHSGTIGRVNMPMPSTRYLPAITIKKEACKKAKERSLPNKRDRNIKASVKSLAACQDNQLSFEESGEGIFTKNLFETWMNEDKNWKEATSSDEYFNFFRKIVKKMPSYQSPHYTQDGVIDHEIFNKQKPFVI